VRLTLFFLVVAAAAPVLAAEQNQADAPVAGPAAPYTYNPDGRRDPFQSLTGTGGDQKSPPPRAGEGLAGMTVDEVTVRGVMQSRGQFVAMVQGPDKRTYLIRQGDKLSDGIVKSVAPDGLVLLQDVNDPRAKEKTREVRKPLHAPEDGKE
jgi:type IV pilus assembly protein PilP